MLQYMCKRLLRSLVTLLIIVVVIFSLLRLMPEEGYFDNYDKLTPSEIENKLTLMGLRDPLPKQLFKFMGGLLRGDLGVSNRYRRNAAITDILGPKIIVSLKFGLSAVAVSLPLGMLLGIFMSRKKGGAWDKFGNLFIVFIQAVPSAVYYLFIQLYGTRAIGASMLYNEKNVLTMVMPVLSLALPSIANYAMWLRRYMVDESNKDYIKLAKAKGVLNAMIWLRHVFRNSVTPMVNLIPGSVLMTISGSIYVESLYSIPGMGGLLVDVIKRQDNTMVQALVIIYSVIGILGLILGDMLMALVDPRISFVKKEGSR